MSEKETSNMDKKEEEKSKNKSKLIRNSVLLAIIYLFTISLTLYFCKLYEVYKEYQKEIPIIRDSLYEITREDLEHYIIDNPSVVIYMCTASNDTCRNFEKELKKYVKKVEITDEIVYLNLSATNVDNFVNEFNNKYKNKTKLTTNFPAFVYFNDGKLETILQAKKGKQLTITKTKSYLELILNEENEEELENIEIK